MKTVAIIQARMGSTRLPGKVMMLVMGKPLLEYQVERLRQAKLINEIVVATTTSSAEQPIVDLCRRLNLPYYRGSEMDVLGRYHAASQQFRADTVIRLTADCPLIDPQVVDQVIGFYRDRPTSYDYVSNGLELTYPRGMDVEIFSSKVLSEAFDQATIEADREHVTSFIYSQPERYHLGNVRYSRDCSHHRWTVDTAADFALIELILVNLYPTQPKFNLEDCLALLNMHPEWLEINQHIQQKVVVRD